MSTDYLMQIAQIVGKNIRPTDKIYAISSEIVEICPNAHSLEWHLLNVVNRHSGLILSSYIDKIREYKKLDPNSVLYTDGILPQFREFYFELFKDIFYVPACPVCFCSCPNGTDIYKFHY